MGDKMILRIPKRHQSLKRKRRAVGTRSLKENYDLKRAPLLLTIYRI